MNASAVLNSTIQYEPPFYTILFMYFLVPLLAGNVIDLGITKLIGSQNCTFDGKEKVCDIAGQTIPSYAREAGRAILQFLIIYMTMRYFSAYFRPSLFPVFGLGVFLYSQTDLIEDFRRFINSLLFIIKYN